VTRSPGRTGARPPVRRALVGVPVGALVLGAFGAVGVQGGERPPAGVELRAAAHFPDGAPARVTGGFGEDSCFACHWEGKENDGEGVLTLDGVPDRYDPGVTYDLEIRLQRPGMVLGGFQLAARMASDTTQAGAFSVPDEEAHRITVVTERGIEFAQHLEEGTVPGDSSDARWTLRWTAPDAPGPVLLHVAAVAGDGDRSQMGDHVYTLEARTSGRTGELRSHR
jgi:hypothetical protein